MVTIVKREAFVSATPITPLPQRAPQEPQIPVKRLKDCPRGHGRLYSQYDELVCVHCGFRDYTPSHINRSKNGHNLVSAGTVYVIRYCGDAPTLQNTLLKIKAVKIRNRVGFLVKCPFCEKKQLMEQASLSGKRREAREERYRCSDGHRVSLLPARAGAWGWK
ncbi:MAG: hypothetical protein FJ317_09615 [SAR202 cluster bacterium]|nr:hypothetical protein [SAR202 cluster bacterium]